MIIPTRQLTQTTIHADDFQDNVYHFPVDSELTTESAPGKLVISTSEGYLLTTSLGNEPKREQSLPYKKQADGRWAIHSVVTIRTGEQGFPDGLVRMQNAQAGTTVLTIQGESTALARIPTTALAVSETALSFGQTAPGQPKSLVFSISQPYADELVTITSDAPAYFLLATDKHPKFTASLSVKPSPVGTYVHVRYLAQKAGAHTGQLLIQSTVDEQTIALTGRTARFLPAIQTARALNGYAQVDRRQSAGRLKIGVAIASIAVVVGLAWFGFVNRQSLFDKADTVQPLKPSATLEKTVSTRTPIVDGNAVEKATVRPRNGVNEKRSEARAVASKKQAQSVTNDPLSSNYLKTETRTAEQRSIDRKEPVAKPTESIVTKQPYRQARPVPAVGESELEKELNQLIPNQP